MPSPENSTHSTAASASIADLKDKTAAAAADLAGTVSGRASDAQASASAFAFNFADTLREGAEAQINAGAEAITSLAQAVRDAADNLDAKSPEVARLVRSSADAVERVSANLRDQSLSELVETASAFGRQRPVAFVGFGVLAGFVLARLFSSSER